MIHTCTKLISRQRLEGIGGRSAYVSIDLRDDWGAFAIRVDANSREGLQAIVRALELEFGEMYKSLRRES